MSMHDPAERKKEAVINVRAHTLLACVCTYLLFSSALLMTKDRSRCTCVFLRASLFLDLRSWKTPGFFCCCFVFKRLNALMLMPIPFPRRKKKKKRKETNRNSKQRNRGRPLQPIANRAGRRCFGCWEQVSRGEYIVSAKYEDFIMQGNPRFKGAG